MMETYDRILRNIIPKWHEFQKGPEQNTQQAVFPLHGTNLQ
jgi:hypothetical protein